MSIPIITTTNPGGSPTTIMPTFYVSTVTPALQPNQTTVANFPTANPKWSRGVQASNQYITIRRGTSSCAFAVTDLVALAVVQVPGLSWPPIVSTQPANQIAINGVNATGTITNDGSNVSNGDTVAIGGKVYTFQTTLTNVDGNVKIGASNTASMTNLFHAINASGGTPGTDYAAATVANTFVTATNPTNVTVVLTAITGGFTGNAVTLTEASTHLTVSSATLSGATKTASFATVAGGTESTITYQWQYLNVSTWTNITNATPINGTVYSTYTTATLGCVCSTTGQNDKSHRCVITNASGATNTASATLSVS